MSRNNEACFVDDGRMNIIMTIQPIKTLEPVSQFLISTADTILTLPARDDGCQWVEHALKHLRQRSLKRSDKGLIRPFLCNITGYSRPQGTRWIQPYQQTGRVLRQQQTTNRFKGV